MKRVKLMLRAETIVRLSFGQLKAVRGGQVARSVAPYPCAGAATDTANGCLSEAGGCHSGWTACGTC